jgi:hypothetical protein
MGEVELVEDGVGQKDRLLPPFRQACGDDPRPALRYPSFLDFTGEQSHVRYSEGIYLGYRYYDARSIGVDNPFGYGLSYTTFAYSDPVVTTFDVEDPLASPPTSA